MTLALALAPAERAAREVVTPGAEQWKRQANLGAVQRPRLKNWPAPALHSLAQQPRRWRPRSLGRWEATLPLQRWFERAWARRRR